MPNHSNEAKQNAIAPMVIMSIVLVTAICLGYKFYPMFVPLVDQNTHPGKKSEVIQSAQDDRSIMPEQDIEYNGAVAEYELRQVEAAELEFQKLGEKELMEKLMIEIRQLDAAQKDIEEEIRPSMHANLFGLLVRSLSYLIDRKKPETIAELKCRKNSLEFIISILESLRGLETKELTQKTESLIDGIRSYRIASEDLSELEPAGRHTSAN
ncbi:MAG: hypothetical protein LBK29_03915 [Oscillospiraceae bacterium]|jgi:hypothetical protein|nr:hypothetical protein [Oscillospiraceae bacterium]